MTHEAIVPTHSELVNGHKEQEILDFIEYQIVRDTIIGNYKELECKCLVCLFEAESVGICQMFGHSRTPTGLETRGSTNKIYIAGSNEGS